MRGRRIPETDRIKMETLLSTGMSQSEVARQLGCNQSTISREYKRGAYMYRNSDHTETEMYSSSVSIAQAKTLGLSARKNIEVMSKAGISVAAIAKAIGCDRQTIYTEYWKCKGSPYTAEEAEFVRSRDIAVQRRGVRENG